MLQIIIICGLWIGIALSLLIEYAGDMRDKDFVDQMAVFLILVTAAPIFFLNNVLSEILGLFIDLDDGQPPGGSLR